MVSENYYPGDLERGDQATTATGHRRVALNGHGDSRKRDDGSKKAVADHAPTVSIEHETMKPLSQEIVPASGQTAFPCQQSTSPAQLRGPVSSPDPGTTATGQEEAVPGVKDTYGAACNATGAATVGQASVAPLNMAGTTTQDSDSVSSSSNDTDHPEDLGDLDPDAEAACAEPGPWGYEKLGLFMGEVPEHAIFKRFGGLSMEDLLYQQAELADLQWQYRQIQKSNRLSEHPFRRKYTRAWSIFQRSHLHRARYDGHSNQQWKLMHKIRVKLGRYRGFSLLFLNLPQPPPGPSKLGRSSWCLSRDTVPNTSDHSGQSQAAHVF